MTSDEKSSRSISNELDSMNKLLLNICSSVLDSFATSMGKTKSTLSLHFKVTSICNNSKSQKIVRGPHIKSLLYLFLIQRRFFGQFLCNRFQKAEFYEDKGLFYFLLKIVSIVHIFIIFNFINFDDFKKCTVII